MPAEIGLHVIAVAYGDPTLLDGALEELGPDYPVMIVDNSSLAETRDVAERHGARYLDAGGNVGFGAGVNIALRALADGGAIRDDVLLLNPDARIRAAGVRRMHEVLRSDPRIAAVGATQTEPGTGAPVRVWWPFPTPWRAWLEAIGLGALDRAHDFAIGSLLLLRAEAIRQVGHFDERFFLYAEETDWQKRATDAGWRIAIADVDATHVGAGTGGDSARREALFFASTERFQRKHHGTLGWQVFRAAMVAGATLRMLALRGEKADRARRRRDIFRTGPVAHLESLLVREGGLS